MRIEDGFMISARNLKKRKGRTILTALGVAIGTSAIVSMLALGLGLQQNARDSLGDFGDLSTLQVHPNWETVEPGQQAGVSPEEMVALEAIEGVEAVMPTVSYNGMGEIKMGRQYNGARVEGIDFSKAEAFGYEVGEGVLADGSRREVMVSYPFPQEFYEKTKVRPVRGETVKQDPMGERATAAPNPSRSMQNVYTGSRLPVAGKSVVFSQTQHLGVDEMKKKEYRLKITGVFRESASTYGSVIYLPIELVEEMNQWAGGDGPVGRGRDDTTRYDNVRVKVLDNEAVPAVVASIRGLGLETWSPTDMLEEMNQIFLIIQLILGGIGSVALLVATIGIINTMSMSILERNKEIGVMKVMGASIPNVKLMFLVESGAIGILGGIAGLAASYGVVAVVNVVGRSMIGEGLHSSLATIPWWLSLFALVFSLVIGVLAGLYPASRAARISPLEAIRNE